MSFRVNCKYRFTVFKKNGSRVAKVLAIFFINNNLAKGLLVEVNNRNTQIGFFSVTWEIRTESKKQRSQNND